MQFIKLPKETSLSPARYLDDTAALKTATPQPSIWTCR